MDVPRPAASGPPWPSPDVPRPPLEEPRTVAEAEAIQDRLRGLVVTEGAPVPRTVAGLDVAYAGDRLAGAVVVLDAATLAPLDEATVVDTPRFPYVPGLFAFRELPALVTALDKLTTRPDLLVADGYGLAHPRRFGLACHLGVLTGLPAVGVGKTPFVGTAAEPGPERGDRSDLVHEGEVVGRALRTRTGVKPVYVSVGHLIGIEEACALVLHLTPRYRLPETTRRADHLSRLALRG